MSRQRIVLVAAVAENGVIGSNGRIPWRIPADFAHFKQVTLGHTLVMGRATYDSIGRPLPGRRTIVLTRDRSWSADGVLVAHSLDQALGMAADLPGEVVIAGGSQVYAEALPLADEQILTLVRQRPDGDTRYPQFDRAAWRETRREPQDGFDWVWLERTARTGLTVPVVVMGVSGSGKSTVGAGLAQRLGVLFQDGDDLHPAKNVAKMAAGHPLSEADRRPWLDAVAAWLAGQSGGVIACSALRRSHRDRLRMAAPRVVFVELDAPREILRKRLSSRAGHFMPAVLLDSQLETLEPLGPDEAGLRVAAAGDLDSTVREAARGLGHWVVGGDNLAT